MTIRNLDHMFHPGSVALIGASRKPLTVGNVVAKNILKAGFEGNIFLVNPKCDQIEGVKAYPDIAGLPQAPDLAIIATPPEIVPKVVDELGQKGTKACVVITAGFGEGGNQKGKQLEKEILDTARPYNLRIIGPNCLGIMVPGVFLNAGFAHIQALPGQIAFVAQSGAIITSVLDWATHRRIGFSHFVSLGDMIDVDFGDMLDYLANDSHTRAILLYIEAVTHTRKFMSAARAAARMKPVIVVKAGRHAEGAKAAASHTGALAGSDFVYDAAFRRAGMLRVSDMQALFDAVGTLAMTQSVSGDRLAILTNGGGVGVLATDTLMDKKGCLAKLSSETIENLNKSLPSTWSKGNPVDIIGDAGGSRYSKALDILLDDKNIDAILVLNCPAAVISSTEAAQAVIDTYKAKTKSYRPKTLLTSWLGQGAALGARQLFTENSIPTYETPDYAVRAFMQMVRYQQSQEMLMQTPPNIPGRFAPDTDKAKLIITNALEKNQEWLTEHEAKAVLSAYEIPVTPTYIAASHEDVEKAAQEINQSVVLKILSPDITHKSDAGGVILDLQTPSLAKDASIAMLDSIKNLFPNANIQGFTVQPMIHKHHAFELIIGMIDDVQFGPVILFGQGGTAVEVIQDKALALPPLNMHLAEDMIHQTRIYRLLKGYRDKQPVNIEAIALTLVKVSQLVCDLADVAELDINPLLADENGVLALDARIKISASKMPAESRLAICPYPKELEETIILPDESRLFLRPIKPEDEPGFHDLFSYLSLEEIRLRFLHFMKILSHKMAARLTQIDYDRQMALVLTDHPEDQVEKAQIYGVVRINADPNNERAEFAILLRKDMTGTGLGPMLMRRIINYANTRGIKEIYGDVLNDNKSMIALSRAFGFTVKPQTDDPGVMLVSLKL